MRSGIVSGFFLSLLGLTVEGGMGRHPVWGGLPPQHLRQLEGVLGGGGLAQKVEQSLASIQPTIRDWADLSRSIF